MRNNLLESLSEKLGSNLESRRYTLSDMISESYKVLYACNEGTNLYRLAESHLDDVRKNPMDTDRLSRQLSLVKELSRMIEANEISDKDLKASTSSKINGELKDDTRGDGVFQILDKSGEVIDSYTSKDSADKWVEVLYKNNKYKRGDLKVVDTRNSVKESRRVRGKRLNEVASSSDLKGSIFSAVEQFMLDNGFEEDEIDDYFSVDYDEDDGAIHIEVRAEVSYEGLDDLMDILNPIIQEADKDSYFEPVDAGIIEAWVNYDEHTFESTRVLPKKSKRLKESYSEMYIDDGAGFVAPGEKISFDDIKAYWDEEHDSDPMLEEYDSFEEWFEDTKEWLKPVDDLEESVGEDDDLLEDTELTDEELDELEKHLAEIRKNKNGAKPPHENCEECDKPTDKKDLHEDRDPDYELQNLISEAVSNALSSVLEANGLDSSDDALMQDFYYAVDIDNLIYDAARFIESKKGISESKRVYRGLSEFKKQSKDKAFYKTFKKMHESLKEGRALTRQESMNLYKAANSALTQMSIELEHNPKFLKTFNECTTLLSADVNKLLESIKNGKAPSKKTMKSLSKFSEALLNESHSGEWYTDERMHEAEDEDDEELDDIESPEEETPAEDEEFISDDEGDVSSEEEEEFDQEYADARVDLHKDIADKHEDTEDPGVQEKIDHDAEEVVNLDGITDEQIAEIEGEEETPDSDEEEPADPEEEIPDDEEPAEDEEDITDDELAELKKHLTEMRKAKKKCK